MQLLHWETAAAGGSVRAAEQELAEIDAFIEAQLRTGVLLGADEWQRAGSSMVPHRDNDAKMDRPF